MNKYQEALDRILNHVNLKVVIDDEHGLPKILRDNQGYQDLYLMKELVDKETPTKTIKSHCGKCNIGYLVKSRGDKYCHVCGYKIDWGNDNE